MQGEARRPSRATTCPTAPGCRCRGWRRRRPGTGGRGRPAGPRPAARHTPHGAPRRRRSGRAAGAPPGYRGPPGAGRRGCRMDGCRSPRVADGRRHRPCASARTTSRSAAPSLERRRLAGDGHDRHAVPGEHLLLVAEHIRPIREGIDGGRQQLPPGTLGGLGPEQDDRSAVPVMTPSRPASAIDDRQHRDGGTVLAAASRPGR